MGAHGRQSALVTVPGPRGALIRARENTDGALDPFSEGAQITPHKRACVWRPAGRRRPAERQDPQIRAENLAHHLAPFIHPITNDSPHTFRHPPPWTVLCADRGGAEGGMAAAGGVSGAGVRVKIPRSGLQDNQDNE